MRYVCPICGYVYDEEREGVAFADLPDSWACPLCGADKASFAPEADGGPGSASVSAAPNAAAAAVSQAAPATDAALDDDLRRLSAGELSALCSNLARGCEKQYKDEEAALFRQIADAFAAAAPEEQNASVDELAALLQGDLATGYPAVRNAAVTASDRGTQRICVWGEKVTMILSSLVQRWQKEGDAFVKNTHVWVCTVCGFVYVGDEPPATCPVCKVPSWKFEKVEGRRSA